MIIRLPIPATPNSEISSTGGIRSHSGAYRTRTYTAFLPDWLATSSATITAMHHNDSIGNWTRIFRETVGCNSLYTIEPLNAAQRNRTSYSVKSHGFQDRFRPFGYAAYLMWADSRVVCRPLFDQCKKCVFSTLIIIMLWVPILFIHYTTLSLWAFRAFHACLELWCIGLEGYTSIISLPFFRTSLFR